MMDDIDSISSISAAVFTSYNDAMRYDATELLPPLSPLPSLRTPNANRKSIANLGELVQTSKKLLPEYNRTPSNI